MNTYKFNCILRNSIFKKLSESDKEIQLKNLYNRNEAVKHYFKTQKKSMAVKKYRQLHPEKYVENSKRILKNLYHNNTEFRNRIHLYQKLKYQHDENYRNKIIAAAKARHYTKKLLKQDTNLINLAVTF